MVPLGTYVYWLMARFGHERYGTIVSRPELATGAGPYELFMRTLAPPIKVKRVYADDLMRVLPSFAGFVLCERLGKPS